MLGIDWHISLAQWLVASEEKKILKHRKCTTLEVVFRNSNSLKIVLNLIFRMWVYCRSSSALTQKRFLKQSKQVIVLSTKGSVKLLYSKDKYSTTHSNPSLFHFFEATITNLSNLIMCLPFNSHLGQCEHLLPRSLGNCEEELPEKPVGWLSVNCRPTVDRQVTDSLPTVYRQVKKNREKTLRFVLTFQRQTTDKLPTGYRHITNSWPTVGPLSADR